ncbi:MAG: hypothetical protein JXB39_09230 [Deltaproteobacteria bacterium]|nr:hypothetical protein [Deltaproteobacteria bacterium]
MADPADLAGLEAPGIAERAETARILGRTGGPAAIEPLLERAVGDRSAGVRLAAAGAVADILSRHRLPPRREAVPDAVRDALVRRVRSIDPGLNPGLFQVVATSGAPGAIRALVPGLRDPRADVRTGALVGLERLVLSAASNGDAEVSHALGTLLGEGRLRPEIAVAIARIAARAGHPAVESALEALAAASGASGRRAVDEVRAIIDRRLGFAPLWGVWTTRGLDVGEVSEATSPRRWLLLGPGATVEGPEDHLTAAPSAEPGPRVLGIGRADLPTRRLVVPYDGVAEVEVLQAGTASWRRATDREASRPIEWILADRLLDPADRIPFAAAVGETLSTQPCGLYARAMLDLWADRPLEAMAGFEAAAEAGRLPPAMDLFRARALAALGRVDEAREAARAFLASAPRRSPWLAEARSLAG